MIGINSMSAHISCCTGAADYSSAQIRLIMDTSTAVVSILALQEIVQIA